MSIVQQLTDGNITRRQVRANLDTLDAYLMLNKQKPAHVNHYLPHPEQGWMGTNRMIFEELDDFAEVKTSRATQEYWPALGEPAIVTARGTGHVTFSQGDKVRVGLVTRQIASPSGIILVRDNVYVAPGNIPLEKAKWREESFPWCLDEDRNLQERFQNLIYEQYLEQLEDRQ